MTNRLKKRILDFKEKRTRKKIEKEVSKNYKEGRKVCVLYNYNIPDDMVKAWQNRGFTVYFLNSSYRPIVHIHFNN